MKKLISSIDTEYKIWALIATIFIVLWLIILNSVIKSYALQDNVLSQADLESFSVKTNTILNNYEQFSNYVFEEFINTAGVKIILQAANNSDEEKKTKLRQSLYNLLKDHYKEMTNFNLGQLNFQLQNGESFLRFHNPNEFGDNPSENRDSIRIATTEEKKVIGFEEGGMISGYRIIYPLFSDEEHIGTVEISVSMSSVISKLHDSNPDMETFYIVEKSIVENLPEKDTNNYIRSYISDDYYFDKEANIFSVNNNSLLAMEDRVALFNQAQNSYGDKLRSNKSFSFLERYNGVYYQLRFLAIKNISNIPAGYLISICNNQEMEILYKNTIFGTALISLIVFLFITFSLIFTWSYIKVRKLAGTDYLTKIYNRQKFLSIAPLEYERSIRYKKPMSILLLDIDQFKLVNDRHGHAMGDRVLVELSSIILQNIRKNDIFARWGGEEFIFLLPESEIDCAYNMAVKLRGIIITHDFPLEEQITVSIGVSTISKNKKMDEIIQSADVALYQAKALGRNCVVKFGQYPEEMPTEVNIATNNLPLPHFVNSNKEDPSRIFHSQ